MGKNLTFNFSSSRVVVVGAGSGIGRCVAEHFIRSGAKTVLVGRNEERVGQVAAQFPQQSSSIKSMDCDISQKSQVSKLAESIEKTWGNVDILVTCAAAPASSGKSERVSEEDWQGLLSVDLDGIFFVCQRLGQLMLKQNYGRIINLTSFHNIATYPERCAYNAAKSGVEGLSRALAVEWGNRGITVNAVAPGPIRTPRTNWFLSQSADVETGMLGRTPTVRLGEPEDVAELILYLASDSARHINGQQIVIDGGWSKSAWWGSYQDYQKVARES